MGSYPIYKGSILFFLIFNLYKFFFLISLIIGTLISISSYSWIRMWIGLEINLLSIIPLLKDSKYIYPSESALKYFITQALASIILLFAIIISLNLKEFIPQNSNIYLIIIINSALLIKIGAAPFHTWFPEVIEGLNWANCLLIFTWQKIAPIILLIYNIKIILFLSRIVIFSSIIRGLQGLNQISLRKILAYSSINHIGWIIARILNSQSIWFLYFLIYRIITFNIILFFKHLNIFFLKQLFNSINSNKIFKYLFILNFLSLGGLPPFLGFFPKWLTINNLIQNNFYFIRFLLITFTLITLYFYLRITFSTIIINTNENLIFKEYKDFYYLIFLNFLSLGGLVICTLIFVII